MGTSPVRSISLLPLNSLNSGADPNILVMQGYKGMSSVLMLILDKYYENEELEVLPMVKLLISRGVDTTLKDDENKTAVSYAKENDLVKTTDYLRNFSRIHDETTRKETYLGLELLDAIQAHPCGHVRVHWVRT